MWVHWAGGVVPGEVCRGQRIAFVGHVRTYNVGQQFDVRNALLLTKPRSAILDAIRELLPDAIAPEADSFPPGEGDAVERLDLRKSGVS